MKTWAANAQARRPLTQRRSLGFQLTHDRWLANNFATSNIPDRHEMLTLRRVLSGVAFFDRPLMTPARQPRTYRAGCEVEAMISAPVNLPANITDPLCRLFSDRPDVIAAYLANISQEGGHMALYVGIDVTGDGAGTLKDASNLLASIAGEGEIQAVILEDDPISNFLRAEIEPFYGETPLTAIDPSRLARLVAAPPKWGNSFIGRMLGNAENNTQVAISSVVQANNALWEPSDISLAGPALIVYSGSPARRLDRRWIRQLARRISDLREADNLSGVQKHLRDRLDAEDDWFFESISAEFSGDTATFWGTVAISHDQLPAGYLPGDGLLPVLIRSLESKKPGELLEVLPKKDWAKAELG